MLMYVYFFCSACGPVLDGFMVRLEDTPVIQSLVVNLLVLILAFQLFLPVDLFPNVPVFVSTIVVHGGRDHLFIEGDREGHCLFHRQLSKG